MSGARLMQILASLARRSPLRTLHTICETQHQISTRKLEQYLESIGDELAGFAFNLRQDYDQLHAANRRLEAELAAIKAQPPSQGGEAVEVVASIAVDAEGVVRDFTLEPGLDRHPGGYTVTSLMTVAQHKRLMAAKDGDAVKVPRELLDRFPEINMGNFGADEVKLLNDWGIEVSMLGGDHE